jgi:hypothetical protein
LPLPALELADSLSEAPLLVAAVVARALRGLFRVLLLLLRRELLPLAVGVAGAAAGGAGATAAAAAAPPPLLGCCLLPLVFALLLEPAVVVVVVPAAVAPVVSLALQLLLLLLCVTAARAVVLAATVTAPLLLLLLLLLVVTAAVAKPALAIHSRSLLVTACSRKSSITKPVVCACDCIVDDGSADAVWPMCTVLSVRRLISEYQLRTASVATTSVSNATTMLYQ